ncbi:CHAP domain-containing protein [Dongia sp.]|uniref:CHAP domain-containing protein n=1 Tax=Dongia sp. TaxID=1977262 RepID=UPI0035AF2D5B
MRKQATSSSWVMRGTMSALTAVGLAACSPTLEPPQVEPRYSGVFLDITGPTYSRPTAPYTGNMQCVPYARLVSGIELYGDAFTWWEGANGRYQRGALPAPGAVLVLDQTDRLRSGHVAVVTQVLNSREILVDHANWLPGQVVQGQAVFDASPANDWTMPRFYNVEAGVYGSVYPARGFIYNVAANTSMPPLVSGLTP